MSYNAHYCGPLNILDNVPPEGGGAAAPLVISAVESQAFNLGSEMNFKSTGGQIYRTFAGIMGQVPKLIASTEALAQFLTAFGIEGKQLSVGVEQYNTLNDSTTAKRSAGSTHEKIAFVACLVVPRSLTCSHMGVAKLNFDILGISSDGATSPVVITSGSVALPTIAGVTEQFTLGPIKINGTVYEGIQDLSIDFGVKEALRSGGGDVYKKLACVPQVEPKITIKSDDKSVLNALTLLGTASTGATSIIYLAKCASNAVRVANATAQHISFTLNSGLWMPSDKGGSHPGVLTTGFEIEPIYDGTHSPIVVSAATAIS